ncbi:MAG: transposase [Flavobacteriales bacterium]|nr:transposase [Flavobacteriales bacterium]
MDDASDISGTGGDARPSARRLKEKKAPGYGRLGKGLKAAGNSGDPVWWDRGYHPHVESPRLIQHVTFHLADSLPREVVEKMAAELERIPPSLRDTEKEKRVAAYLDAGIGSCVLRIPELGELVQRTILHFHGERYTLHAWCVMPNHVHVLFHVAEGWTMGSIIGSWKKFTARRINSYLKEQGMGAVPTGASARLESGLPPVWHRDYFDRFIRDAGHYTNAVDYIHNNPVKAGLVRKAEDWRWSSGFGGKAG